MKKSVFLFMLIAALPAKDFAQSRPRFHSQNYAGMLQGESGAAVQLHSINGVQYRSWFLGLGAGLDNYRLRSVPLFLSVSRFLQPELRSFFLTLDGGTNFALKQTGKTEWMQFGGGDFSPSFYAAGGMGYRISLKNSDALLLYAGYSAKRLVERTNGFTMECLTPPCPEYSEKYTYTFNTLSLKLGWQF